MSGTVRNWFTPIAIVSLGSGCSAGSRATTVPPTELPSLEAERARHPDDRDVLLRLGQAYYQAGRHTDAIAILRAAMARGAGFPAHVYLGLAFEGHGDLDSAVAVYDQARGLATGANERAELEGRLASVSRARLTEAARRAIATEARLAAQPPAPNTIAVLPWMYVGTNDELRPLERGIAHLLVTDFGKVSSLVLLERERVQVLADELALTAAQRVEPGTGARSGRLLRAGRVVQGSVREQVRGGDLRLEARLVNATSGAVTGTGTASDRLQQLFAMEKQIVFALLEHMRITLSPAERQALSERPTADLQAFLAFSRGLEAEDRGDFLAAGREFNAAIARDPAFRAARDRALRTAALGRGVTPSRLASIVSGRLGPTRMTASRALALRSAIAVVAPTTGGRLLSRALALSPLARPRIAEALRQDDPTRLVPIGEIVIVIPRP